MKRRLTAGDIIFDTINVLALSFMAILCLYPIYYCVVASISDPNALAAAGGFMLWPKGVQFGAYKSVFANKEISSQCCLQ